MATRTRRGRPCNFCPHPGADCCVRVQGDQHIYAHQNCATVRGVWPPLYVFTDEPARPGEAQ